MIHKNFSKENVGEAKKDAVWLVGSAKSNGREPRCCLGRVINFKLGSFT
jgi:hypothetical protein